jgi:integrase
MASIYKRRNKSGEIVYYGAIRVNGELIRRKLGISLKSAKRQLKKLEYSLLFDTPDIANEDISIENAIDKFIIEYNLSGVADEQVYNTQLKLRIFHEFCNGIKIRNIGEISTGIAKEYILQRSKSRVLRKYKACMDDYRPLIKPITLNKDIRLLKRVFAYCVAMEWITKNPFELVNPVKEDNKTERYYFSEDEITMILDNADNYFDFYSILYHTGLRATDAYKLTLSNIQNGYLTIQMNKTGDWLSYIPLPTVLIKILKNRIGELKKSGSLLFPDYDTRGKRRIVVEHLQSMFSIDKVRKCNINLHTFRHTYAHRMLNLGVPKEVLQTLLGHRSVKTTEIYANWVKKDDLLKWVEMIDKKNKT